MLFVKIGIFFCMLSVVIGAFGAHSLESMIGDKMDIFKTGIQYHMFHGLGLILIGILSKMLDLDLDSVGYLLIAGIILFSGSLYVIAIYKYSFLGVVAPIGGMCFIIGWLLLFYKL